MNKFYKVNRVIQWIVSLLMFALMLFILNVWVDLIYEHKAAVILIFFVVPVIQFLATPLFTLIGLYTYLSPMLIVFAANNRRYDLHNGTSFDYLMVLSNLSAGTGIRKKILEFYIDGLLTIVDKVESKTLQPDLIIRGSSYFLSSSTAERLGFKQSETSMIEKINILLNYIDMIWMYTLANGRLSFPNMKNIRTVSITGEQLSKSKPKLLELKEYFRRGNS